MQKQIKFNKHNNELEQHQIKLFQKNEYYVHTKSLE